MPRTKVSKNSKRNRNAAIREEKIREFDSTLDQFINSFELKIKDDINNIDIELSLMKTRISQNVLSMKMGDLINMNVSKFCEIKQSKLQSREVESSSVNQTSIQPPCKKSKDDEGYNTEDSRGSGIDSGLTSLSQLRTWANTSQFTGPLSSAKARKSRRSRSACGYTNTLLKSKPSSNTHTSRQKTRTPLIRQKAISADRTLNTHNDLYNSPTALLRWPKPGELIISVTGTPVVSRVMPEQYANVNIPIRDGVLSLRPKKLQNLDPEIVHKIDRETLSQIKLLQSNLELIMSYADKTERS